MSKVKGISNNINDFNNMVMKEANGLWHTVQFIIKGTLTSTTFYSIVGGMTLIGGLLSGIFFPFTLSSPFDYFLMVTFPILVVLGWYNYSIRNSNVQMGLNTIGHSKLESYGAQFISTWILGTLLTIWFLISFEAYAQMGLILKAYWANPKHDWIPDVNTVMFNNSHWILNLIYVYNLNILVTFSLFYLVHIVIKDQKQYYIALLVLILLTFIYGGMLNEFFESATTYGNGVWYPEFKRGIFPEYMFWPSLMFPYFSVNSMFSYGFTLTAIEHREWFESFSTLTHYGNTFWHISWTYSRKWTLVFFAPYVWVGFSALGGTLILIRSGYTGD